jgi:hypothetical protein
MGNHYKVERCWNGTASPEYFAIVGPGTGAPYDSELYSDNEKDAEIMAQCAEFGYLQALLRSSGDRDATEAIKAFVERVERRAENEMLKTHKLEGAHYRAMKAELAALSSSKQTGQGVSTEGNRVETMGLECECGNKTCFESRKLGISCAHCWKVVVPFAAADKAERERE